MTARAAFVRRPRRARAAGRLARRLALAALLAPACATAAAPGAGGLFEPAAGDAAPEPVVVRADAPVGRAPPEAAPPAPAAPPANRPLWPLVLAGVVMVAWLARKR